MQPTIYIKGLDQLEKAANKLVKAVNEGKTKILLTQAKFIRDGIKEKAPLGPSGNLKKAAYAVAVPETLSEPTVAYVGIRPKKAPHAHLIEYGTSERFHKSGKSVGKIPGKDKELHPFFRPAVDERLPVAKENIARELGKTIEGAV
jgi:HK97 gp10 family phage protein